MQKTTQERNDAKKELAYFKSLADAYEKRNWKLNILNDNLYWWVFTLWTALLVSVILNLIQLAS